MALIGGTATARVEAWAWVCLYGGLGTGGLGVALLRNGEALGWAALGVGVAGVAAGAGLVWFRSRLREPVKETPS